MMNSYKCTQSDMNCWSYLKKHTYLVGILFQQVHIHQVEVDHHYLADTPVV